ncbi:TPA: beta-CASP ribonuclease aCPSF1, partial [Candidatus Bathyarchaeota archaeon]|nr:beta-CASP ribonuclease aCPSF1 [Candidatus Bathyarchaeota archaeon]
TCSTDYVSITGLGGCGEVGRSAILIRTPESSVLLDCGINPGSRRSVNAFPRLDDEEFDLSTLDAVIISHAHLDHCGFLPFLYKYGYKGPIYCSSPTYSLMILLQLDYLDVIRKGGLLSPYSERDVRKVILHTITVNHGEVNDIAPDIRLTLHNAGHILGSSIIHLHIGEGLHNVVYTGDFKFSRTKLLESAVSSFPRIETLIVESTYGSSTDIMPQRSGAERILVESINRTVEEKGGKVLVPVPAVGRAQEIMLVLDKCMREGSLVEIPIFVEGMVSEATAIHTAFPSWLSRSIRDRILVRGESPFESEYFTVIKHPSDREEVIYGGPCVVLATSGMLEGGPAIDYFRQLAQGKENTLIFVSYQIDGTLGSRVERKSREVPVIDSEGRIRVVKVNCDVLSIKGFSGHSDRREIVSYVGRLTPRPRRVVVCHGERSKSVDLARTLHRVYNMPTSAPLNLETIRLR